MAQNIEMQKKPWLKRLGYNFPDRIRKQLRARTQTVVPAENPTPEEELPQVIIFDDKPETQPHRPHTNWAELRIRLNQIETNGGNLFITLEESEAMLSDYLNGLNFGERMRITIYKVWESGINVTGRRGDNQDLSFHFQLELYEPGMKVIPLDNADDIETDIAEGRLGYFIANNLTEPGENIIKVNDLAIDESRQQNGQPMIKINFSKYDLSKTSATTQTAPRVITPRQSVQNGKPQSRSADKPSPQPEKTALKPEINWSDVNQAKIQVSKELGTKGSMEIPNNGLESLLSSLEGKRMLQLFTLQNLQVSKEKGENKFVLSGQVKNAAKIWQKMEMRFKSNSFNLLHTTTILQLAK